MRQNPRARFALLALITSGVLLQGAGCGVFPEGQGMPDWPRRPNEVDTAGEVPRFYLAVYQVEDYDSKREFGRKLGSKSLQALRIAVENDSTQTVALDFRSARLQTDRQEDVTALRLADVRDSLERSHAWALFGLPLFIIPFFSYWGSITDANQALGRILQLHGLEPARREYIAPRPGAPADVKLYYLFFPETDGIPQRLSLEGSAGAGEEPLIFQRYVQAASLGG